MYLKVLIFIAFDPPEYLRQLALELINSNILDDAFLAYTYGSRNEMSYTGSCIYIRAQDNSCQFNLRNTTGCSVFCSDFNDIDSALDKILVEFE
ncbi:hypothetical protein NPIL_147371 [Nephila pilipes]|uniref:Uncharacterized protein n=1 Tax=Nephila pilipes TaxID=299642 RepID=A0A8X6TFR3_NEPPI|nr:hypothetical protein NPIL_147371 [Nephila pilipes]